MTEADTVKKRVLVIEDEPIVGRLCRGVLTAKGYQVDIVTNGLEAKEVTSRVDYDLCISDIRLPGLTGINLYEHWKSNNNPITDKVIFITGDTMDTTVLNFLEKSRTPCLLKPFELQELAAAVERLIS